jgi:hypothetical protein
MSKPLIYKEKDFKILFGAETYDSRIPYVFHSKNGKIHANFFYVPGNCEVRGLVGKTGTLHLVYPLLNKKGDFRPVPSASKILRSIIKALKRGEY